MLGDALATPVDSFVPWRGADLCAGALGRCRFHEGAGSSCRVGDVAVEALLAPTRIEAERAAEELARAGASRVLLFGSVARDEAWIESDIDLIAVFDDIDYSSRFDLRSELVERAESATGRRVQICVTDWPEWKHRTERVSASFEAQVAAGTVVLFDREPVGVRWDKEIGLPDSNDKEALDRLAEASKALNSAAGMTLPYESEHEALLWGDNEEAALLAHWRLIDVCRFGAMTIETALKSLAALEGSPARRGHVIGMLVDRIKERRTQVESALAELGHNTMGGVRKTLGGALEGDAYGDVSMWREAGDYIADRPEVTLDHTSRLAPATLAAAAELVSIAATELESRLGADDVTARAKRRAASARRVVQMRDMRTGASAREAPDTPTAGPATGDRPPGP